MLPLSLPAVITLKLSGNGLLPIERSVGIERASDVTSGVVLFNSSKNRIGVSFGFSNA